MPTLTSAPRAQRRTRANTGPLLLRASVLPVALAAVLATPRLAGAQQGTAPPMVRPPVILVQPPVPLQALPPNIVTSPDGSVSVTRTPAQGVDVHAPTPAGTVHAYGCSRVDVDAQTRVPVPAAPCPYASPYVYGPPPAYYLPPLAYQAPPFMPPRKPRYAPDPARKAALIGSSLVFGLGTAAAGGAYVASATPHRLECALPEGCADGPAKPSLPALYTMGGFLTVTPSVPRLVVGDVGMAVLLTALRGGSFAAGAFIDWKDETHVLPVTLAFVVPLTLGIIDLATTPHREDLEDKPSDEDARATIRIRGIGPTALSGARGELAPAVGAHGTF